MPSGNLEPLDLDPREVAEARARARERLQREEGDGAAIGQLAVDPSDIRSTVAVDDDERRSALFGGRKHPLHRVDIV